MGYILSAIQERIIMEHWIDDFEHSSITDENRESFNTHMSKFDTQADAVMDGYGLAKQKGKPFKLPEAMDKLDEASRSEFTAQAHKLLGITKTKDIAALKDVNLKDGMAEGAAYNEEFANSFKHFVIDNDLNVNAMPKLAKFFNVAMAKFAAAQKAKTEADNIAAAEKTNEALIAHPSIGSKEKLLELTELFTRAFKNHLGLTADEVKELANDLSISKLTKHPVLARIMLHQFAPLAATASTEEPGSGNPPAKDEVEDGVTEQILWPKEGQKAPVKGLNS